MTAIDLNADLGEGETTDDELLKIVSSCNVACGGHIGGVSSMSDTVCAALANHVAIGAHPSYPDREGFGRRRGFMRGEALQMSLIAQMQQLKTIADSHDAPVTHAKPHGALYNDAADDLELSRVVATAVQAVFPGAALLGLPNSALATAADEAGLPFLAEGFVDRSYRDDGRLVARDEPNALLTEPLLMARQAISLLDHADTLCIHGDTPDAVAAAIAVRSALTNHGVDIRGVDIRAIAG